jgi:hypothetical protein
LYGFTLHYGNTDNIHFLDARSLVDVFSIEYSMCYPVVISAVLCPALFISSVVSGIHVGCCKGWTDWLSHLFFLVLGTTLIVSVYSLIVELKAFSFLTSWSQGALLTLLYGVSTGAALVSHVALCWAQTAIIRAVFPMTS